MFAIITKYHTFFPTFFYTEMIENDLEWFEIVILILEKKGVYPITKYHTFFPRPIFDTKIIENNLKWFDIVILM